jgi:hypothetical protein
MSDFERLLVPGCTELPACRDALLDVKNRVRASVRLDASDLITLFHFSVVCSDELAKVSGQNGKPRRDQVGEARATTAGFEQHETFITTSGGVAERLCGCASQRNRRCRRPLLLV